MPACDHAALRILCFGDSLTAGYWQDGRAFHPYATTLHRLLGGRAAVDHVGLSGWTSTQMVSSMDDESCIDVCRKRWTGLRKKLGENNYSHCVILAGTNDVCRDSAENIFNNIRTLASTASSQGCNTIVLTIPELAAEQSNARIKTTRRDVNALLLQCDQEEASMSTIDLAPSLPYASAAKADRDLIWERDGLHLRPPGYDIIASVVYWKVKNTRARTASPSQMVSRQSVPTTTHTQTHNSPTSNLARHRVLESRVHTPTTGRPETQTLTRSPYSRVPLMARHASNTLPPHASPARLSSSPYYTPSGFEQLKTKQHSYPSPQRHSYYSPPTLQLPRARTHTHVDSDATAEALSGEGGGRGGGESARAHDARACVGG